MLSFVVYRCVELNWGGQDGEPNIHHISEPMWWTRTQSRTSQLSKSYLFMLPEGWKANRQRGSRVLIMYMYADTDLINISALMGLVLPPLPPLAVSVELGPFGAARVAQW